MSENPNHFLRLYRLTLSGISARETRATRRRNEKKRVQLAGFVYTPTLLFENAALADGVITPLRKPSLFGRLAHFDHIDKFRTAQKFTRLRAVIAETLPIVDQQLEIDAGHAAIANAKFRWPHEISWLRTRLELDRSIWQFRWRASGGSVRAGDVAGCLKADGYRYITIDGVRYCEHVLVWMFVNNEPVPHTMEIDHIDGDKQNNSPDNLRLATHSENMRNTGVRGEGTSPFVGVNWYARDGKWLARIRLPAAPGFGSGRHKYLGLFLDEREAARAYDAAALEYHGEFAKTNAQTFGDDLEIPADFVRPPLVRKYLKPRVVVDNGLNEFKKLIVTESERCET